MVSIISAIIDDVENRIAREVIIGRGIERLRAHADSETPAERYRRENEEALREMAELGNTRDSAMIVAKRKSDNPHTQAVLAQRFRDARRRQAGQQANSRRARRRKK